MKMRIYKFLVIFMLPVLFLGACSGAPSPSTPTAALEATVTDQPPATVTLEPTQIPTATLTATLTPTTSPSPTVTASPTTTATPQPTATPGIVENGFTAWCARSQTAQTDTPWIAPVNALVLHAGRQYPELTIPSRECVFVFTFNQPAPQGLVFQIAGSDGVAWMHLPLTPAADNPNILYIVTDHVMITNPPYWEILFHLNLVNADGVELWAGPVDFLNDHLPSWRCQPYGDLPDPVTGRCKREVELEPGNPGYGTPGPEG